MSRNNFTNPSPQTHAQVQLERLYRGRAEEERRRQGEEPKDWADRSQLQRFVNYWIEADMFGYSLKVQINILLRRKDITFEQAAALILEIPRHEERIFEKCVEALPLSELTHEQRLFIMNNGRLLAALPNYGFRQIRDEVLANGDCRALGLAWTFMGTNGNDYEIARDFRRFAISTHSLECIRDLGDESVEKADAFLFERLRQGLGPELDTSYETAQFISGCYLLTTTSLTPEEKAELASAMIIELVGHQSRESREARMDIGARPQHQKLRTLDYLIGIIAEQMMVENAGVILRWTMGRHRHHKWVWERIMAAFRVHRWRIATVEYFPRTREVGVSWRVGNLQIVVLPPDGNMETVGKLEVGNTVFVPPHHLLGSAVARGEDWVLYKHPLHPLRPPTTAMREALQKSKT